MNPFAETKNSHCLPFTRATPARTPKIVYSASRLPNSPSPEIRAKTPRTPFSGCVHTEGIEGQEILATPKEFWGQKKAK